MKNTRFLPIFFTILGVAFCAAVRLRLRSYGADAPEVARQQATLTAQQTIAEGTTSLPNAAPPDVLTAADPSVPRTGETAAQLSARERRYQELLNQDPPPAPIRPVEPPKPPSFFDRVVNPIASALGMNRAKPQSDRPGQQPPPQRPTNDGPQSRTPTETSGGNNNSGNNQQPQQDDDPETDIVPPQLLMADFNPPQIHDGETTTFAAMVNDNLSGVRAVSGVIASPSGSMQGFSATREGETNRFIAKITIPPDAAEGKWVVKYLTLSDNASNSVNLNSAQGALPPTAQFTVVSAGADAAGPQLKSVWLERQSMRGGEKNTVFVQAEDEKTGVSLVSGVFVSPAKTARIGFGCRAGNGGVWECSVSPPTCLDCGTWRLEQVQLQDKANNLTTFRQDNPVVGQLTLDIMGDVCDSQPPAVTNLVLDPTVVSNAQASTITVTATMVDEGGCGVASISGQAIPPGGVGGQRRYISFGPSTDGQTFVGKLEIPQFAAKGVWTIAWILALDKGHNLRAYSGN
ncbi:MAG: hypothetical protein ACLGH0_09540, partial [Thermoanaerobaculia bacterium]